MATFTAHAQRDGDWWIAQLDEDPGVLTQARRIDQVPDALRDALTLFPEFTLSPHNATIQLRLEEENLNAAHETS